MANNTFSHVGQDLRAAAAALNRFTIDDVDDEFPIAHLKALDRAGLIRRIDVDDVDLHDDVLEGFEVEDEIWTLTEEGLAFLKRAAAQ
ncbi:hypothetical protein FP2506_11527 [Fulvimarina pelagi HTCC2506]|uniref:Uncharacterized protein n=1 Tax=Fulvimarina pelagi HTCC2506 TaxID=314231 RepID=Q0FYX4_9HYPH|nr:hypothetical protein [Fulvimarina pelagi]EAU40184.1 hypothetical protein FP2506_11527 [Fulvimarina pelagi HTCC2506]